MNLNGKFFFVGASAISKSILQAKNWIVSVENQSKSVMKRDSVPCVQIVESACVVSASAI